MNIIKLSILFCLLTFGISCGQQKKYISHKVGEGETLKKVAKLYKISKKDLIKLNPDKKGKKITEGEVLIVPNIQLDIEKENINTSPNIATDTIIKEKTKDTILNTTSVNNTKKDSIMVPKKVVSYKEHVILPKETVYALCKKFNISKEELIKWNPSKEKLKDNKLNIGDTLKVKEIITNSFITLEEDIRPFIVHVVKSNETVYKITKFYNIDKDSLTKLNPHLPNLIHNSLNIGDILKIRKAPLEIKERKKAIYNDSIGISRPLRIAYLLPLNAKKYDTIKPEKIFKNRLVSSLTDFYLGSEIAIDSIKKQGIDVNVKIFDTGKKGKKTAQIINQEALDKFDVFIGPFYADNVNIIAQKTKKPIVFPHFSRKQNIIKEQNVIKSSPNENQYIKKLTTYLKTKYDGENIFIVGDGSNNSDQKVEKIIKQLGSLTKTHILKPEEGYIKKERFTDKMKPNSKNWVIITSENNVAIEDVLNSFVVIPEETTVQLFTINKNKGFKKIDNNKLARLELVYISDEYTNENDANSNYFIKKYYKKNFANPSRYAKKGFDVTYDIIKRLASNIPLNETFKKGSSIRCSNKFDYINNSYGSENRGLFIIKHKKDLTLQRIE